MYVCVSVCVFVCVSVCLSVCVCVCLCVHWPVYGYMFMAVFDKRLLKKYLGLRPHPNLLFSIAVFL